MKDTSVHSSEPMSERVVHGTVEQFLEHAADPSGKILNALDFPGWDVSTPINSFSDDLIAWHFTRGAFGHTAKQEYPRGHMNWYLAGTANTMTFLHIDSDGVNTVVGVLSNAKEDEGGFGKEGGGGEEKEARPGGMKLWMMASPLPGCSFATIDLFLQEGFSLEEAGKYFKMEGVVLTPGTRASVSSHTKLIT